MDFFFSHVTRKAIYFWHHASSALPVGAKIDPRLSVQDTDLTDGRKPKKRKTPSLDLHISHKRKSEQAN